MKNRIAFTCIFSGIFILTGNFLFSAEQKTALPLSPIQKNANPQAVWDFVPQAVATVGDKKITKDEFLKEISVLMPQGAPAIPPEELKNMAHKIVERMIDKIVFTRLVEKDKITPGPQLVKDEFDKILKTIKPEAYTAFETQLKNKGMTVENYIARQSLDPNVQLGLAINRWLEKNIASKINVTDEEAERYYRENQARFQKPETARVSHILVKPHPESLAGAMHENIDEATQQGKINAERKNIQASEAPAQAKLDRSNIADAKLNASGTIDSNNNEEENKTGKDRAERANISMADASAEAKLNRENLSKPHISRDASSSGENLKESVEMSIEKQNRANIPEANKAAVEKAEGNSEDTEKADKIALEKAKAFKSRILQGEDFGKIAENESECPVSKSRRGDLGDLPIGVNKMLPELEDTVSKLKIGEVSDPVKTKYGYHLVKVTDRKKSGYKSFDDVKESIKEFLKNKQMYEMLQKTIEQEKQTLNVKVNI